MSESGPVEPEGCCLECSHLSHSPCLVCGMSDQDCIAKIWPIDQTAPI